MQFIKFGEFLVRNSNGKVIGKHIAGALAKQKLKDGYKKLGEILVEDMIITREELTLHLTQFEKLSKT